MRRLCVLLCAAIVFTCALPAQAAIYYGDFDWRQYDGPNYPAGNYVTPIRNQGSDASCWSFSAVAAVESRFLLNAGTPGIDLDLSEEHLDCDRSTGMGGHEDLALKYIRDIGITDEATLPYITGTNSPLWPVERPYTLYRIGSVRTYISSNTNTIKSYLESYGPLSCCIDTSNLFKTPPDSSSGDAEYMSMDFSIPEWFQGQEVPDVIGPDTIAGGAAHSVCIVGYKDESSMPEGGYWIIKNSWGNWGDSGYGFIKYGKISNRVHAVTGSTYTEEAPSWAPVAVDDTFVVDEDSRLVRYQYNGIRTNDTDINTPIDALTILKVTDPAHGTIELTTNGSFTYTPDPNFCGADSFKYRAYDGVEYSDLATVTFDVTPINDVPIVYDDAYTCQTNSSLIAFYYDGVLANDYDADNHDPDTEHDDTLSIIVESGLSHGFIQWYTGGGFMYVPESGFSGTDSLTYKVFDGTALSNLATVVFEVGGEGTPAVPEPSTMVLLATMALGLAMRHRKSSR